MSAEEVTHETEETQLPAEEETPPQEATEAEVEQEEEELLISFGEQEPKVVDTESPTESGVLKQLRKNDRVKSRRIRELEAKLAEISAPPTVEQQVGPRPTRESVDYDDDRYDQELIAWTERKRAAEEKENAKRAEANRLEEEWQAKQKAYHERAQALKLTDHEDAQHAVRESLGDLRYNSLVYGAKSPELFIYGLYKHPDKLTELAQEKDPVKFTFLAAEIAAQMKTETRKKAPPPPETKVVGTASIKTTDATYDRLMDEASKTGNYSKVGQYLKRKRNTG